MFYKLQLIKKNIMHKCTLCPLTLWSQWDGTPTWPLWGQTVRRRPRHVGATPPNFLTQWSFSWEITIITFFPGWDLIYTLHSRSVTQSLLNLYNYRTQKKYSVQILNLYLYVYWNYNIYVGMYVLFTYSVKIPVGVYLLNIPIE